MKNNYKLVYSKKADKQLEKFDKHISKLITKWLLKNVDCCKNPRAFGKPLKGKLSGQWRYEIGDYRILCDIQDNCIIVLALTAGHRKEVYKN